MVRIKNLNGTSDNFPPCGYVSWKEYWEKNMKRKFSKCSCVECRKPAEVGAHVMKDNGSNKWYIVPLCIGCNNRSSKEVFWVNEADLLSV